MEVDSSCVVCTVLSCHQNISHGPIAQQRSPRVGFALSALQRADVLLGGLLEQHHVDVIVRALQ